MKRVWAFLNANKVGEFRIKFSQRILFKGRPLMSLQQKIARSCRNPHKGMRLNTSERALASSHRSACGKYNRFCKPLTEKRQALYDGTNSSPRKRDVVELIMKFEHFEMFDDAAKMYDMYGYIRRDLQI